ncbi:MAG: zf-TFIIB domain-containing protein [Thermaceae bacterium]|nr:zf-TFIIB domain-containing protein [Thermaceae bacterium]
MPLLTCPNDSSPMQEVNRNGVTLDICPTCRGVWLDRGELEKLLGQVNGLERDYRDMNESARQHPDQSRPRSVYDTDQDDDYYRRTGKKKSKLGRLFDIFD